MIKKTVARGCVGPDCGEQRGPGRAPWCKRCREVPEEVRERWLKAVFDVGRTKALNDRVWDRYLDARAAFKQARS